MWKDIEMGLGRAPPQAFLSGKEYKYENSIVNGTLELWHEVVKKYKMKGDSKLLIWPSKSPKFRPGVLDKTYERWSDRGITAICSLVEGQNFKSFELKREFNLENDGLFRYLQLRHFYDTEIKKDISAEGNDVIQVLTDAYKKTGAYPHSDIPPFRHTNTNPNPNLSGVPALRQLEDTVGVVGCRNGDMSLW